MIRRVLVVGLLLIGAVCAPARAVTTLQADSIGPLVDVTGHWHDYQPASVFCIKPDAPEYTPGGTGPTTTGRDRACRSSGFPAGARGLVKIAVATPVLCAGCRRLFIDFSHLRAGPGYAHGHVYYHLMSPNFTYTVDPIAHSPNTKNFTNDKLVTPTGSLQEPIISGFDGHAIAYVTDAARVIHNAIQGPYYIGPWYLNRRGQRIAGVYLDVSVASATRLPIEALNAIAYVDGFNSGQDCPSDADAFYAGCVDSFGFSATTVDPFIQ